MCLGEGCGVNLANSSASTLLDQLKRLHTVHPNTLSSTVSELQGGVGEIHHCVCVCVVCQR